MDLKAIQQEIGTAADGIFGPKTAAALAAARYDIVIDAGHTADHAREYPADWPAGTWDTPAGKRISHSLQFRATSCDSIEHRLNLAFAGFAASTLRGLGYKVLVYDDPTLANKAEYTLAAKIANAARPRVFLSIHNNGSKGVRNFAANTACGSITYYRPQHGPSELLAAVITQQLLQLRARHQVASNRADRVAPGSSYHVLNATPAAGASVLAEVGFYDHAADLEFLALHQAEIGHTLAAAITHYLAA